MKKIVFTLIIGLILSGCSIVNQVGGAITFSQCEYVYNSISNIQLAGLKLGDTSNISVANLAKISSILAAGDNQNIPFNMTLKVDVSNPNQNTAFLNSMDYVIILNDMEFADGKIDIPIRVEPGETKTMRISVGVDLTYLMNRYSREKVSEDMYAFLGLKPEPSKVMLKLWPKVIVGNTPIKAPAAIPVVFTFGGK